MHVVLSLPGNSLDSLGRVSAWALIIALVLHVLKVAAEARSWHTIVRHAYPAVDVGFGTTFGGFAGAVGANTVLPARIGEALRFGVLRRRVPSSTTTVATTIVLEGVVELIFGVVVVATVLLGGRSLGPVVTPLAGLRSMTHPLALGASLAALGGLVAVVALQRRRLRSLAAGMAQGAAILRAPRAFVCGVLCWKLVAWTLRLAAVYWFLIAFHLTAGLWALLLVVGSQSAVSLLPISPGNAGTQQAAFMIALAGSGSTAAVLGFGVGMQAAFVIVDLVIGGAAMAFVARRLDTVGLLGTIRCLVRTPSGGFQATQRTVRP